MWESKTMCNPTFHPQHVANWIWCLNNSLHLSATHISSRSKRWRCLLANFTWDNGGCGRFHVGLRLLALKEPQQKFLSTRERIRHHALVCENIQNQDVHMPAPLPVEPQICFEVFLRCCVLPSTSYPQVILYPPDQCDSELHQHLNNCRMLDGLGNSNHYIRFFLSKTLAYLNKV